MGHIQIALWVSGLTGVTYFQPNLVKQTLFSFNLDGKEGSGVTPKPYSFCQIPDFGDVDWCGWD